MPVHSAIYTLACQGRSKGFPAVPARTAFRPCMHLRAVGMLQPELGPANCAARCCAKLRDGRHRPAGSTEFSQPSLHRRVQLHEPRNHCPALRAHGTARGENVSELRNLRARVGFGTRFWFNRVPHPLLPAVDTFFRNFRSDGEQRPSRLVPGLDVGDVEVKGGGAGGTARERHGVQDSCDPAPVSRVTRSGSTGSSGCDEAASTGGRAQTAGTRDGAAVRGAGVPGPRPHQPCARHERALRRPVGARTSARRSAR